LQALPAKNAPKTKKRAAFGDSVLTNEGTSEDAVCPGIFRRFGAKG
jgi:hypothetical protein